MSNSVLLTKDSRPGTLVHFKKPKQVKATPLGKKGPIRNLVVEKATIKKIDGGGHHFVASVKKGKNGNTTYEEFEFTLMKI